MHKELALAVKKLLPLFDYVCDRFRGSGLGGTVILPEEGSQCRGDLTLRYGRDLLALSQRRRIRTQETNPNGFRTRDLLAVVFPLDRRIPSTVVGQEDERGFILVLRHGLHGLPEVHT
jgi:hypothetical protein